MRIKLDFKPRRGEDWRKAAIRFFRSRIRALKAELMAERIALALIESAKKTKFSAHRPDNTVGPFMEGKDGHIFD